MPLHRRARGERGRDAAAAAAAALVVFAPAVRPQDGPQRALELVERELAVAVAVEDAEDGRSETVVVPISSSSVAAAAAVEALERSPKLDDVQSLVLLRLPCFPAQESEEHGDERVSMELRKGREVREREQARVAGEAVEPEKKVKDRKKRKRLRLKKGKQESNDEQLNVRVRPCSFLLQFRVISLFVYRR